MTDTGDGIDKPTQRAGIDADLYAVGGLEMQYEVFGEFKVPRKKNRAGNRVLDLGADVLNEFWAEIDRQKRQHGLSSAKGCYIFGIRTGGGIRPWYVGQTTKSFQAECFASHKCNIYHTVYGDVAFGNPILILIARRTRSGDKFYMGKGKPKEFDFLEKMLIGLALGQNPNLANKKDTKILKGLTVPGVFNKSPGRVPAAAQALQLALGL